MLRYFSSGHSSGGEADCREMAEPLHDGGTVVFARCLLTPGSCACGNQRNTPGLLLLPPGLLDLKFILSVVD